MVKFGVKKHYTKKERTVVIPEYIWRRFDAAELANTGDHLDGAQLIAILRGISDRI